MSLIPVTIGERTALIDKPEPPRCSVPGCHGDHWTSCDYPIKVKGAGATCDAQLCVHHVATRVVNESEIEICPSHCRFVARAK
jgi:hypothetical protein